MQNFSRKTWATWNDNVNNIVINLCNGFEIPLKDKNYTAKVEKE